MSIPNFTPKIRNSITNNPYGSSPIKVSDVILKSRNLHRENPHIQSTLPSLSGADTQVLSTLIRLEANIKNDNHDQHIQSYNNTPKVPLPDKFQVGVASDHQKLKLPLSDKTNLKRPLSYSKKNDNNKKSDIFNIRTEDNEEKVNASFGHKVDRVLGGSVSPNEVLSNSKKYTKAELIKNDEGMKRNRRSVNTKQQQQIEQLNQPQQLPLSPILNKKNPASDFCTPQSASKPSISNNLSRNLHYDTNYGKIISSDQLKKRFERDNLSILHDSLDMGHKLDRSLVRHEIPSIKKGIRNDSHVKIHEDNSNIIRREQVDLISKANNLRESHETVLNDKAYYHATSFEINSHNNNNNKQASIKKDMDNFLKRADITRKASDSQEKKSQGKNENNSNKLDNIKENLRYKTKHKDEFIDRIIQNEGDLINHSIWTRYYTQPEHKPNLDMQINRVQTLFNSNETALQDLLSIRQSLLGLYIQGSLHEYKNYNYNKSLVNNINTNNTKLGI